jgi:hypothetical protein
MTWRMANAKSALWRTRNRIRVQEWSGEKWHRTSRRLDHSRKGADQAGNMVSVWPKADQFTISVTVAVCESDPEVPVILIV